MRGTARFIFATVAVAMVLAACGGDAERYDGVRAVAAALGDADMGCSDVRVGDEAKLVTETGSCSVEGDRIDIFIFQTAGDRDKWTAVGARVKPSILGPNWAISGAETTVRAIADQLGGEVTTPE